MGYLQPRLEATPVRIYPWPYLQILDWPDKLGGANTLAYIVYSQQLIFKNFFDQFSPLSLSLSLVSYVVPNYLQEKNDLAYSK